MHSCGWIVDIPMAARHCARCPAQLQAGITTEMESGTVEFVSDCNESVSDVNKHAFQSPAASPILFAIESTFH